jgi:hypothetical protein
MKSTPLFYGRYGWIGLLGLFLILQCSFKDPEAPRWDVPFILPLINETHTMQQWADDEEDLYIDESQTVLFRTTQEIDKIEIHDFMKLGNIDTVSSIAIVPVSTDLRWKEITLPDEGIIVKSAEVRSGTLQVAITNRTNLKIDITFEFPSLTLSGSNSHYTFQTNMYPGQVFWVNGGIPIDLSGAMFTPPVVNGKNVIRYGIKAFFPGGGYTFYDDVEIDLRMHDLVLQHFLGGLDRWSLPMKAQRKTLDLPDEFEGVSLGPTQASLSLTSLFGNIPGGMDVKVQMGREDGLEDSLLYHNIPLVTDDDPAVLTGIETLLNLYPDYIDISGSLHLGVGYDEANLLDIWYDDYLTGKAEIQVPLIFQFPENLINELPVDTLDLYDEENEDKTQTNEIIRDNINYAGIVVDAINHFPFGAKVTIIFSKMRGDSTIYMSTHPTDVIKVIDLEPGNTGNSGLGTQENPNFVTSPENSTSSLVLTKEELKLFESPEVYIGIRIEFYPTDALVKVFPMDYITIKAKIEASLNTKVPEDKDEEGGGS